MGKSGWIPKTYLMYALAVLGFCPALVVIRTTAIMVLSFESILYVAKIALMSYFYKVFDL